MRVIDGDTFETSIDGKRVGIKMIGLDAPQGNTPCGRLATAHLRQLVSLAMSRVGLHLDEEQGLDFDVNLNRLYHVSDRGGNRPLAEEMVKAGFARARQQGRNAQPLMQAEEEARRARRGCIWDGTSPGAGSGDTESDTPGRRTGSDVSADPPTLADDHMDDLLAKAGPAAFPANVPMYATLPDDFALDSIASGLSSPTAFAFLPDGRILIAQKSGLVRVYKNGALQSTPFIDIRDRVNDYWDRGLLGITADADFANNGFIYLLYAFENDIAQYDGTKTARLARYTANGDTAAAGSEVVILGKTVGASCNDLPAGADCIPSDAPSHSVGNVKAAPDGTLFVTLGDGAHFNVVNDNALRSQNLDSLGGKVLHITASGTGLPTNPLWSGDANANRSKIWAYGARNPYRFNLRSGSVPYFGDVGWNTWEEINVAVRGANLGWPCYEGTFRQAGYEPKPVCQELYAQGTSAIRPPLIAWRHDGQGFAATGGAFYTGSAYPEAYRGKYFYADHSHWFIRFANVDESHNLVGSPTDFSTGTSPGDLSPVDVQMGPDDSLYYISIGSGELRRIRYAGALPPLDCPVGQFRAEYFGNRTLTGTPTFQRCEPTVSQNWGSGGPGNGIGVNDFSVRWTGRHNFTAGDYTFTAATDDGMRVWLDDLSIIDEWRDQAAQFSKIQTVAAGEHEVKVEYYEHGGGAQAVLSWQAGAANLPPTVSIAVNPTDGPAPLAVQFTSTASDPNNDTLQYSWDFGDGSPVSTAPNPSHTYTADGAYTAKLTVNDGRGGTDDAIASVSVGTFACPTGQFLAEYFNNMTLTGTPVFRTCETAINHNWGTGGPGNGIGVDKFSVRWTGTVLFAAGDYTFTAVSDDGIRVKLDDVHPPIIDSWQNQSATLRATRTLTAGEHSLKVEYYEDGGGAVARLSWEEGVPNRPPTVTISTPSASTLFKVGDVISYSGSASDPDEGTLPASALAWKIDLYHCPGGSCHVHPFLNTTGTTGTFTAPDHGDDSYFVVTVTATDSGGLTGTNSVTIHPQTVKLTLATSPPGLEVVYGGDAGPAPITRTTIVGSTITIYTPSPQNGLTFSSWSDSGAQQHNVTVGATDVTYTATFTGGDTQPPTISAVQAGGVTATDATITWTTDEASDTQVEYGPSTSYGTSSPLAAAPVTAHSVGLTGLTPGTLYHYRVKSKDAAGNLATSPDATFTTAAGGACPANQYRGEYFNNATLSGTPTFTRCDAAINFDWGAGSPGTGVDVSNFSVRWTLRRTFVAGDHTVIANTDDGVRVWIDGTLLIDAWRRQGPTTFRAVRNLTAGEHELRVEYFDASSGALARVSWQVGAADTAPPAVTAIVPAAGATRVAADAHVTATFSEGMTASTVTTATVQLVKSGTTTPVAAGVTFDPATFKATLDPTANLDANSLYTVTIKGGAAGVKDAAGNALAQDFTSTFRTRP